MWLVLHAKYVEYLHFLHVERGLTISKVTDTSLEICGLAAVPFFGVTPTGRGLGEGAKGPIFVENLGKLLTN